MEHGDYNDELLAMQGIDDIRAALPPVIGSAQQAGRITAQAAEKPVCWPAHRYTAGCSMWCQLHCVPA